MESVTLGAIDAGSNALRVVVARLSPNGDLERLAAERIPVRLGHGAFTRGELDDETIDAAVAAFRQFRAVFDEHDVHTYRAVATSAMRNAYNRDVLLHRLHHEAHIEVEVIRGDEEARLVRKAVMHAFRSQDDKPRVILDLGGGSLEINLLHNKQWRAASMPIGTVRLVETFGITGAIGDMEQAMIRRAVKTLIATFLGTAPDGLSPAVACGGNPEALARLFGKKKLGMPALKVSHLEAALPEITGASVKDRMRLWDVRRDRAEVMGVAAVIIAAAAAELGLSRLFVPGVGIRDAVLLDLAETIGDSKRPVESARGHALLTSARTFANRVGHDATHSEHVRWLARSLFDQLADLHGMPEHLGHLLEVAALLHDVGVVVDGRGHHKHGEYMVLTGRIPGLESPEREMVAALVRTHRKSMPDPAKHQTLAALGAKQQANVRKLQAILRIADGLDTDHRQRAATIQAKDTGKSVTIKVTMRGLPDEHIAPTHRKEALFESEFERAVEFDVRDRA